MKFTQQIKDNWLKALKSGEYKQGYGELWDSFNGSFCCIGVLGHVTDGIDVNQANTEKCPYNFLENAVGWKKVRELYRTNDSAELTKGYKHDYSNVIPLIEALEVQE